MPKTDCILACKQRSGALAIFIFVNSREILQVTAVFKNHFLAVTRIEQIGVVSLTTTQIVAAFTAAKRVSPGISK